MNDFKTYIEMLHKAGIEFEQQDLGESRSRIVVKSKHDVRVHSCATFSKGKLIELGTIVQ